MGRHLSLQDYFLRYIRRINKNAYIDGVKTSISPHISEYMETQKCIRNGGNPAEHGLLQRKE